MESMLYCSEIALEKCLKWHAESVSDDKLTMTEENEDKMENVKF